jgi:hypothetical protein
MLECHGRTDWNNYYVSIVPRNIAVLELHGHTPIVRGHDGFIIRDVFGSILDSSTTTLVTHYNICFIFIYLYFINSYKVLPGHPHYEIHIVAIIGLEVQL